MLDDKGRCCGRKPIHYKGRLATRQLFCCRCNRSYDVDTKQQRENFAWEKEGARVRVQAYYKTPCTDQTNEVEYSHGKRRLPPPR